MKVQVTTLPVLLIAAMLHAGCGAYDGGAMEPKGPRLELTLKSSLAPLVGEKAELCAVVLPTAYVGQVEEYRWSVFGPDQKQVQTTDLYGDGRCIRFLLELAGQYQIACDVTFYDGRTRNDSITLEATEIAAGTLVYTVRVTPPPALGAPAMDKTIAITGKQFSVAQDLEVDPGVSIPLEIFDGKKSAQGSFVRLWINHQDLFPVDHYWAKGHGTVSLPTSAIIDALVIPDSNLLAPDAWLGLSVAQLTPQWTMTLDPGQTLRGVVQIAAKPLVGATVVVHTKKGTIAVPSTVGQTDQHGAFSLRARAGQAALTIVPPPNIDLPLAQVAADSGLQIAQTGHWSFSYERVPMVQLSAKVLRSDGKPAVGALLSLHSDQATKVGTLTVAPGVEYYATATGQRSLIADKAGQVVDSQQKGLLFLPAGKYSATVHPAANAPADDGPAAAQWLQLAPKQGQGLTFNLSKRVVLKGRVTDSKGTPVTAVVIANPSVWGGSNTFATQTDSAGGFKLLVDNGKTYAVRVRPVSKGSPSLALSPALSEVDVPKSSDKDMGQVSLGAGIAITGTVRAKPTATTKGFIVEGARLQVWCSGGNCPGSKGTVVDETRSDRQGAYSLTVPVP